MPEGQISSLCPDGAESSTAPDSALDCPAEISGCGHGTAVALAAAGDFAEHAGIARDAELIALQIFSRFDNPDDCDGQAPCVRAFVSDLIRALEHVYRLRDTHPIVVANLSLGEGRYPRPCDADPSRAIIDQLRAAGIATVVASGNDGYRDALRAPACITPAISVGTATGHGTVSLHANSAEFLDLLAPSLPAAPGTSLAAPLVSGAWAVLKQAWPEASVDEILDLLKTTGQPVREWTPAGPQLTPRLRLDQALAQRPWWSAQTHQSIPHLPASGIPRLGHPSAELTVLGETGSCTPGDLTPSGTVTGTQQFHACQTITTGPDFTVGTTAVVTFRAGQRITLSPGFRVQAGGRFTANISSTLPPSTGNLQVTLTPPEAVTAGAQWRRTGTSTWRNSGTTETGIPVGQHTVEFKSITDWITPNHATVTLTAHTTTPLTGSYQPQVVVIPPDPETVAPPVDTSVATTTFAATEFLYTGANPIQTGVAPGTIEAKRAAVLRGRVLNRDNQPLPGVTISITITINNRPEFGQTLSRADGWFDLAVNGGGPLTLNYARAGYLPAQRQINVPWQDFALVDDVVLIPLDSQVTTIDLSATTDFPAAQGPQITDQDGSRQPALLIPPGTQATRLLPGGGSEPLTTLSLRLTEYTVGPNGPQAMPAPLPANVAYTYALEISADEAPVKRDGQDVLFDRPVPFYVTNFLDFPVGGEVPMGYYDYDRGVWVPSDNGRVIRILSISNGRAVLDVTGGGSASSAEALAELGITDAERERLATLYPAGASLWRVPITHLSTWDCNWPFGPPRNAIAWLVDKLGEQFRRLLDKASLVCSSVIECENQILGQHVPVVGTGLSLNYRSDRVPGQRSAYVLTIPLSGDEVPDTLKRIEASVAVAGRRFDLGVFPGAANQSTTFAWDGVDAYGREVTGSQPATITVSYVYDGEYQDPADGRAFGRSSGVAITGNRTREEIYLSRSYQTRINVPDFTRLGIGGWSLDVHHVYDPLGQVLYQGDGSRRSAQGQEAIITTVAGSGDWRFSGDGGPATAARLSGNAHFRGISLAPDGSFYIADTNNNRIRRVSPPIPGFDATDIAIASEDGRLLYRFNAEGRHLSTVDTLTGATLYAFAYDAAGRLTSITDADDNVITIERDGAGNPTAIVAPFGQRTTLTLNGAGYLATVTNPAGEAHQLSYTADGLLTAFTDPNGHTAQYAYDALGRLQQATDAAGAPQNLARADLDNGHRVNRTTALNRLTAYTVEDLSTSERRRTVVAPDNTQTASLIGTDGSTQITAPDGTVSTTQDGPDPRFGMQAPIPTSGTITTGGLTRTHGAAVTADLSDPNDPLSLVTLTATATRNGRTATSIYTAATRRSATTSPANRQSYSILDATGRPIETGIAGLEPVWMDYDTRGRLVRVAQGAGASERTTTFTYNAAGYLASATDPLGQSGSLSYDLAGRVLTQTLANGETIGFEYDASGNLTALTPPGQPAHGFTYNAVNLATAYTPPAVVGSGATSTLYDYNADKQVTRITRPDGGLLDHDYDSAGRLATLTLPQGSYTYAYNTVGQLASVTAPGGVGLAYAYSGALLTGITWSGPITGSVGYGYDTDFRVTSLTVNGANPIAYQYDPDSLLIQAGALSLTRNAQNGLLTGTALGDVSDSYTHNAFGELSGHTARHGATDLRAVAYTRDALGRITEKTETVQGTTTTYAYAYDLIGQLIEVRHNGSLVATYSYDPNGNRLSKTGPGPGISETGTYDAQDRLLSYAGATYEYTAHGELRSKVQGGQTTTYAYDALGNLRQVTLPDGRALEYLIDGQNRRIGKRINGSLVQGFLYQGPLQPVAEFDGNGNLVSRFVYATGINVPDYLIRDGQTYRLIKDHLGSPRLVVNTATGEIVQRLDYDEYGQVLTDTNPGFQPFGFAGGIYDRDTGLVRFGARDYDPRIGRWTAKDPIGFEGGDSNLYSYVSNAPIRFVDPFGLQGNEFSEPEASLEVNSALEKGCREAFKTILKRRNPLMGVLGFAKGFGVDLSIQASRSGLARAQFKAMLRNPPGKLPLFHMRWNLNSPLTDESSDAGEQWRVDVTRYLAEKARNEGRSFIPSPYSRKKPTPGLLDRMKTLWGDLRGDEVHEYNIMRYQ